MDSVRLKNIDMEIELTIENKTKFFAQYWGQNVFGSPYLNGSWDYTGVNFDEIDADEFMLLKPLSAITDEDAIELAKLLGSDFKIEGGLYSVSITIQSVKEALTEAISIGTVNLPINAIDYLRSKGYALPWMGLSVEEMIKAGWIKLIP